MATPAVSFLTQLQVAQEMLVFFIQRISFFLSGRQFALICATIRFGTRFLISAIAELRTMARSVASD
jgi:hypothetical protein